MEQHTLNMTTGKPMGLIVRFALPLMLANVFQQLYTVVDTAIVGKALGVDALAAMGAADWLNWMMYGMVQGLTQGFAILVAQNFGARQMEQLRKTVGASIILSAVSALVLMALLQLAVDPVLALLQTPAQIADSSRLYLRVMFSGVPIVMAYNLFAGILRSLGDSKTPLAAMIIASLLNIALDLLFVLVFHWGIAGAAAATLIAQVFAALYCLYFLLRSAEVRLHKEDLRLDGQFALRLLKLGSPMAFQNGIISVGGMILQFVVNGFGVVFIAGYTATNKLYGILEIAAISYGYSTATFTGQNLGAGQIPRIQKGHRASLILSLITSALIGCIMILFGKFIVGCFLSGEPVDVEAALDVGYRYLTLMSLFLPVLYILHVERSCLQGMGNTVLPMVSGIAEFIMRTGAAFLLPGVIGDSGIFWAEVLAWAGADLILIPSYFIVLRSCKKQENMSSQH